MGKARMRYEFGCKGSVVTTLDEGFVIGMRSFTGNLYDGHPSLACLDDRGPVDRQKRPGSEASDRQVGVTALFSAN